MKLKPTLLLCILLAAAPLFAGEPKRPTIGLALAGGSARGLAHIGVLEWLEEHRIPVDYIAGTSMGGLVAAYYATGSTPQDLRRLIRELDWDDLLSGAPAYRQLAFRRKEDRRAFPNAFELGLRNGMHLPIGLNGGHKIGLVLDRLAAPYYDIKSFDDLPIPFRCVATDILNARSAVFKDGPLSDALRATMAIPVVFAPVEIGGVWYADGGLLNNLPADVVKEMGADIVIAVQLDRPPVKAGDLQSFIGMVDRSINIMIYEDENRHVALADVALKLNLGQFGSSDFKSGDAIADLGYKEADKLAEKLARYALDEDSWRRHLEQRRSRRRTAMPAMQFVEIEGTRAEAATVMARQLLFNLGQPLNEDRVRLELDKITGWGRYDGLGYRVYPAGGQNGLKVRVREKRHGPPFLNLGVEINGSQAGHIQFILNGRLTVLDLGAYRAEWRTDVSLGARNLFATEYCRPLRGTQWFVAPRAYHESVQANLYDRGDIVAEYRVRNAGAGADLSYAFGRFSELRMGYELTSSLAEVRVGDPLLPAVSGKQSTASVRWNYDAQDSALVPRAGMAIRSAYEWVFDSPDAERDFPRMEVQVRFFQPVRPRTSLFMIASGGTTFGREASILKKFTMGGPMRLGALGIDEVRVDQYARLATGMLKEISRLPPLAGGSVFAAAWHEMGKAFHAPEFPGLNHTASAGLVVETAIGPLFLGGSVGQDGRRKAYFMLGRLF